MTPGWTRAMRLVVSMSTMASIRWSDTSTQPSTALAAPVRPVPAPRGTIGTPAARAASTTATTSAVDRGLTSTAAVPAATKAARSRP